jgi:hypothetical protein
MNLDIVETKPFLAKDNQSSAEDIKTQHVWSVILLPEKESKSIDTMETKPFLAPNKTALHSKIVIL